MLKSLALFVQSAMFVLMATVHHIFSLPLCVQVCVCLCMCVYVCLCKFKLIQFLKVFFKETDNLT